MSKSWRSPYQHFATKPKSHIWIGGDFNFTGYNLKINYMKNGRSQTELTRKSIDLMADNDLTQVVSKPTFHPNTLDLFFTNNRTGVCNTKVIPGISVDGHHAVYVKYAITLIRNKHVLQRQTGARLSLMYMIVHNLVLIEAIQYVKL